LIQPDRYAEAVERCLAIARTVADDVRRRPLLRLVVEPELSVLLFERRGWTRDQYVAWSRTQALAGRVLCIPTRYGGQTVLRLVFVNPSTDPAAVSDVLDTLA
jgi:glutamate/tyrosine decarboxylase-like PLP-dependent enzyme